GAGAGKKSGPRACPGCRPQARGLWLGCCGFFHSTNRGSDWAALALGCRLALGVATPTLTFLGPAAPVRGPVCLRPPQGYSGLLSNRLRGRSSKPHHVVIATPRACALPLLGLTKTPSSSRGRWYAGDRYHSTTSVSVIFRFCLTYIGRLP